jgi:hypothetical protein
MAKFRYLGTAVTNKNCILEEVKSRLNLGNACCHSVQNILSSCFFSKSLNIKIYKIIILPVFCMGVKRGLPKLREECRLRLFENRVLRRIFGPKREEEAG